MLPEPLSELQRVLRTTLLYGLVGAARHNVNAGNEDVALFEIAHVYLPTGERFRTSPGGSAGSSAATSSARREPSSRSSRALKLEPRFERAAHPFMPSPASAHRRRRLGRASSTRACSKATWSAFELDLAELFARVPERVLYEDVITYPPVRQDLAFSVPEEVTGGDARRGGARGGRARNCARCARSTSTAASRSAPGRKSVAFAVTFQSPERTLSDEDAARLRGAIVDALAGRFGAELRAGNPIRHGES